MVEGTAADRLAGAGRPSRRRTALSCALIALLWGAGSARDSVAIDPAVRDALAASLRQRVEDLLLERNDRGEPYKRGTYSREFRRVDDSTFHVAFTRETAGTTRLKTERLRLALGTTDGETWNILDERLEDTYGGLVRADVGDEQFYRFDAVQLDHDGLTVTGGEGSLFVDFLEGDVEQIVLVGDGLSFSYEPPAGTAFHVRQRFEFLRADDPEALDFEPERVSIRCSPAECYSILAGGFAELQPVGKHEADGPLVKHYEREIGRIRDARRENGFHGFRRPWAEDRGYRRIFVNGKSDDHNAWLTYDSWGGWEITFGCSGYGTFLGYYAEETSSSAGTAADLERRRSGNARDFEVQSVRGTVELALDDSETMTGDVTYRIVARRSLRELPVYIARLRAGGGARKQWKDPSISIDSIEGADGQELMFVKRNSAGGLGILPEEVAVGTVITLRIRFENRAAIYKLTPSYSRLARSGWLPLVRFGDMIDELDLTVNVPARYETLGVGEKVSESSSDGVSTTRWVANHPVSFPTIIFGLYHSDTAGFDAERSDGSKIPVRILVDRDGMTAWRIRPKQLRPLAQQAVNSLNLYREVFGVDYPFNKLDMVNDPMGFLYGQSPASLVYLGSATFRGSGVLTTAAKFTRSLVAHEVGHQWWGGLVCHANDRNYWFVESLAEYASALFVEAVNGREDPEKGRKAYLDHVQGWRRNVLEAELFGSVQDASSLSVGGYYAAIYSKGPYALHILRTTFGDERFFAFLRKLANELKGREVVTRDIQRVAEEAFESSMEWFFDQWIRGVGLPEYTLSYEVRPTEDGAYYMIDGKVVQRVVIEGKQRHSLEGVAYQGVVPLTVTGRSKQEYTVRLAVEERETPFRFKVPERPVEIALNKYGEILAHDVIDRSGPP